MRQCLLWFVFCCSTSLTAQNFDSLWNNVALAKGNDSLLVERYLDLGFTYIQMTPDKVQEAKEVAEQALNISLENEWYFRAATSADLLGNIYGSNNEYEASMEAYNRAIKYCHKIEDYFTATLIEDNKANFMLEKGFYEDALEIKLRANQYFKKYGDSLDYAISCSGLGALYLDKGKYELAKNYLLTAYPIAAAQNDDISLAYFASNLALAYKNLGQTDSAFYYFYVAREKSSTIRELHENNEAYLSTLLVDEKRYEEAQAIIQPLAWATQKAYAGSFLYRGILAECYAKQEQYDSAFYYFEQLEANLMEDRPFRQMEFLRAAHQSYKAAGNYEKAYQYYESLNTIQDSINSAANVERFKEIETKYAVAEKEKLIVEQQLALRSQMLYIGGLLGLLAIGLIVLLNWQQRTKLLRQKNGIIAAALKEKEALLKEIHHRVKNNLQVISSLLSLQARRLEEQESKEALKASQSRVQSMALIHKDLYSHDDLSKINIQRYLENLSQQILASYQSNDKQITLNVEAAPIEMDVDTLIPIGLIVNELVTNALKYAFDQMEEGALWVKFASEADHLILSVADNGIGIQENEKTPNSFGMKLIRIFAQKLNAKLEILNQGGTLVRLAIPNT